MESHEVLSCYSLGSILTSLQKVRMVEPAVAGKRHRVVSGPDRVSTSVFRLFGISSPRRVTEIDAPAQSEKAAPA